MWVFIDMVRPCGDREEMGQEGVTNGTRGGISLQITLNDGKNIEVESSHWKGVSSSLWQNNGDLQMEQKKFQKNTNSTSSSRWQHGLILCHGHNLQQWSGTAQQYFHGNKHTHTFTCSQLYSQGFG